MNLMSPPSPRPPADPAPTSSSLVSIGPLGSSGEPKSAEHILKPCHIDRLPTEILASILSHLPPPTIFLHNDRPRLVNAPLVISLVSRRFHAVIRDHLWRRCAVDAGVTTTSLARAAALFPNAPHLAQDCHELRLFFQSVQRTDCLERWATWMPAVRRLILQAIPRFDLDEAAHFQDLRHLSISFSEIVLETGIVFPRLESLHLGKGTLVPRQPVFNKSTFPALRRIVFAHSHIKPVVQNEDIFPNDFLAQLDHVEVGSYGADAAHYDLLLPVEHLVRRTPILWRLDLNVDPAHNMSAFASARPSFLHAHFLILNPLDPLFDQSDVATWTERVLVEMRIVLAPPSHPHLRLVLVPAYLWYPSPHNTTAANEAARRAVEDVCARRGVVLRTYAARRAEDAAAVPEFLAFLREEAARDEGRA
ncbi:uncharacterized protein RHOBADRAFT_56009 [Rhodotorula graminis WP1]|uniref:F-box domain-containing protein n=1 Tax=Rhodotorula graminis (strain WP1) TaxID=578459 RepID=A0A0P9GH05_RHOGW|nr:uncharacterized protein RHOBADRAFT_56009 [Rhodotorula graminis WP1]KPV72187.1 hypothetical protein RHOBADRAFT_56009 [Rhodotorula graminis WP1]